MSAPIVERLRARRVETYDFGGISSPPLPICIEAADTIEALLGALEEIRGLPHAGIANNGHHSARQIAEAAIAKATGAA